MIKVSDAAAKKFYEFAAKRENPEELKLRIALCRAGWAGTRLGVALDEHKFGSDIIVESNGVKVAYTRDLADHVKNMRVDYSNKWYYKGFLVY